MSAPKARRGGATRKRWHVYLLACADGTLYCGVTNDLPRRIAAHDAGRGAKYTAGRGPVRLLWSEPVRSHGDALRRELAVKRLPRKRKLALAAPAARAGAASVAASAPRRAGTG